MDYREFLDTKKIENAPVGVKNIGELGNYLFDFQKDIVRWALNRGRAAIFADCGMGKTIMQLEWAKQLRVKTLILAPLAVAGQTVDEGSKFGIFTKYCRHQKEIETDITITNYEMLDHFEVSQFEAVVLDESSILKSYDGKFRTKIIESFQKTPYRLACTATPAPNDFMELGNHSEFLGALTRSEMLSMFFVHDGGETQKWRIKGHADQDYWRWVCSWAVMIRKPSDIGYDNGKFKLPTLRLHEHIVESSKNGDFLFPIPAATLQERISARRDSIQERVNKAVEIINKTGGPWIVWCNLNSESSDITKRLNDAVEVKGSDSLEKKTENLTGFPKGAFTILVSKPSIAGFGMNYQHCSNVLFLGISDSYEQFYQAIRRSWRFGQKKEVNCHIVISRTEGAVLDNIKRKERDSDRMATEMVKNMSKIETKNIRGSFETDKVYFEDVKKGNNWTCYLGDSVEIVSKLKSDSIHYSVFSPPFASLYTYTNSDRDMGNCKTQNELMRHFRFLVSQLYRVLIPGRLLSFHCMNLPTSKQNHGYIGIRDFRGDLIRLFEKSGFIYHSEVCIWKDPVTAMQRTKALGLLHKQLKKDACMSRQGIPDYLVTMRKPGANPYPVSNTNDTFPVQLWQNYASPVWMDINPSKTLQHRSAREHKDERHICPLQLEVIERAIKLWTNEGDAVLSPFSGIGSEGYVSLQMGRKYIGVELKRSYWEQSVINLAEAESNKQADLLITA